MIHVVIGGSGYLGNALLRELDIQDVAIIATYNTSYEVLNNEKWIQLNVGDRESVDSFFECIDNKEKYTFYYLASIHHPDKVEQDWKMAWEVNITGLSYFLSKLPNNADLVYSSTDHVYGESDYFNAFNEDTSLKPVNEYGVQKSVAEKLVLSRGYKVARYCFLIGPSKIKKAHFYDVIVDSCHSGKEIDLLSDSFRSVITFDLASHLTVQLMTEYWKIPLGIFNVSSDAVLSKYTLGLRIVDESLHHLLKPISIKTQLFFIAKRPENVTLNNDKIKKMLNLSRIDFNIGV